MDVEAIDNSKENIQPLKQGRNTAQLAFALHAQSDQEAQQKLLRDRDKHELAIRLYDGPDPIQPRYVYVQWLEQYYPKHGRESNLAPLLEDTISNFKDDPKYKQDQRFVELVIKYIDSQQNALELYQLVYGLGIGTMCSIFYKAWAEELDRSRDLKRADQIYQLGIAARAQPLEMLQHAHIAFQLSVGRRMLQQGVWNETEQPSTSSEDGTKRNALGKLKKSTALNSFRPSKSEPGTVPLISCNRPLKNAPVQIYQDEETDVLGVGLQKVQLENFPKSRDTHRENTVNPGPWNKSYNRKVSSYTPSTPLSASKVQVYMDEEPQLKISTPLPSTANALKPRKLDEVTSCPMALFEPPDPSMMPMYCKQKVYAGGREFQLEEIRAAIYNKRYEAWLEAVPQPKKVDVETEQPKVKGKSLKFDEEDQSEAKEDRPENFSVFLDLRKPNPKFAPIKDSTLQNETQVTKSTSDEKCFKNPFPVFYDDEVELPKALLSKSPVSVFCDDEIKNAESLERTSSSYVFGADTTSKTSMLPEDVGEMENITMSTQVSCDGSDATESSKSLPVYCNVAEKIEKTQNSARGNNKAFSVFCDDYIEQNSKSFLGLCDDAQALKRSGERTKTKGNTMPIFCDDDIKDSKKAFPVYNTETQIIKKTVSSTKIKGKIFPVFCDDSEDKESKKSNTVLSIDAQPGTSKVKNSSFKVVCKDKSLEASGNKTCKLIHAHCEESGKQPLENESKKGFQAIFYDEEPQRRKDTSGMDLPLHIKKSMFAKDHSRLPDSLF